MPVTRLEKENRDRQWEEQFQPLLDRARGEGKTPTPPEELQKTINELSVQNSDLLDEIRGLKKELSKLEETIKQLSAKFNFGLKFLFEYERMINKFIRLMPIPKKTLFSVRKSLRLLHKSPQAEECFFYSDYYDIDGEEKDIF